jgi:hypothetical protein
MPGQRAAVVQEIGTRGVSVFSTVVPRRLEYEKNRM